MTSLWWFENFLRIIVTKSNDCLTTLSEENIALHNGRQSDGKTSNINNVIIIFEERDEIKHSIEGQIGFRQVMMMCIKYIVMCISLPCRMIDQNYSNWILNCGQIFACDIKKSCCVFSATHNYNFTPYRSFQLCYSYGLWREKPFFTLRIHCAGIHWPRVGYTREGPVMWSFGVCVVILNKLLNKQ